MVWFLLCLIVLSAGGCFTYLVLSSVNRRLPYNRYASAAWTWAGAFVLSLILLPVYSQSHYMFLDEPLVIAAREGRLADVRDLLARGADVNAVQDDGGGTALVAASAEGHTDVVRYLLAHGAKVSERTDYFGKYDRTPLQMAAKHPEIRTLLRQSGATE